MLIQSSGPVDDYTIQNHLENTTALSAMHKRVDPPIDDSHILPVEFPIGLPPCANDILGRIKDIVNNESTYQPFKGFSLDSSSEIISLDKNRTILLSKLGGGVYSFAFSNQHLWVGHFHQRPGFTPWLDGEPETFDRDVKGFIFDETDAQGNPPRGNGPHLTTFRQMSELATTTIFIAPSSYDDKQGHHVLDYFKRINVLLSSLRRKEFGVAGYRSYYRPADANEEVQVTIEFELNRRRLRVLVADRPVGKPMLGRSLFDEII